MLEDVLNVQIYEEAPSGFVKKVQVSACYVEIEGLLLLLRCACNKQEAGKWGVPAGKLEEGETPREAAIRELFEETGINASRVYGLGCLYIRKKEIDYVYHLFKVELDEVVNVCLSNEHEGYLWASQEDLEVLPLMAGAKTALQFYKAADQNKG
ncbi:MAG: NUDIX hydrolase [Verrucomicrobia bacterium]|nr:NUDIX hydrolase [Verrucomicrobiota bacterium]